MGCPRPSRVQTSRRALLLAAALVAFTAATAFAGDVRLQWRTPCFQADPVRCDTLSALPELALAAQHAWAVRFRDQDTLDLGEIPEVGKNCTGDSADFEFAPGTMGAVIFRSRRVNGKLACTYASYVFAIPAVDSAASAPGLSAEYFDDIALTVPFLKRIDPSIDFDWDVAAPIEGMDGDEFSIRWTGSIQASAGGSYRIRARVEDAVRLWIGTTQVLDSWAPQAEHDVTGAITLQAGAAYPITVEYFARWGTAACRLFWTPPGELEQIVPAAAFSH